MKHINLKASFALAAVACVLGVAALAKNQTELSSTAMCERKETNGTSTFGKCDSICKGQEVTRDAANNRWVCSAAKSSGGSTRPGRVTPPDKAPEAAPTSTPKPTAPPKSPG